MNARLFVYGSLMSSAGHPMGARLAREARLIGPATMAGRLYRVSWYPGVVDDPDLVRRVHGEVYLLKNPMGSLIWLDAYEGLGSGNEEAAEYRRVERPVVLADGVDVSAWVYLYQKATVGLSVVPDGRWSGVKP